MRTTPSRWFRYSVLVLLAAAGLAGCSVDDPSFTGIIDAPQEDGGVDGPPIDAPPGTLTVEKDGTATGRVTSNPGGIDCGTTCSASFGAGAMVTLTATPDTGAAFTGWSGGGCSGTDPCTVTVDAAVTVRATFDTAMYPVTIELGGTGSGSVSGASAGINCPTQCTTMVAHGSSLSLTATTGANSLFVGWTVGAGGTACTGTGSCSTTITGPTTITATFSLNQTLEVTKSGNGTGTVVSNPAGITCGADCSETYPPATAVTLTATAAADSIFNGWSGACTGTGPCMVTVNSAVLVTAEFVLRQYTLTVNKAGLGAGTVTSAPAGINCGATCASNYDAGTTVTLTASPTAGSIFACWSGVGCTGTSTCSVTMAAATTVTATFTPILHTLTVLRAGAGSGTVTSSPIGINCGADCVEDYPQGTTVTRTAMPSAGSMFTGWSGGGCTGTGTCMVTMSMATTVTATFTAMTVALDVSKTGTGNGTVTSAPPGINCGTDCTESYTVGTGVTLSAAADPGSTFAGWSGGGCAGTGTCMVTMSTAQTVTATFTLNTYPVTVTLAGNGGGSVASTPAGITCGADCAENFGHGTMVTLTATPAAGSTFTGWTGGGCTGTAPCMLTVTASAAVTATFTADMVTLTVTKTGTGSGTVTSTPAGINCGADCTETVVYGTMLTLSASPAAGSIFNGWTGGGCSGTGSCVVPVTAATTVTADFALAPYALTVSKTGTGSGTVTSAPAGINCGADCTEPYTNGTSVTLTATPAAGSTFGGWSGGGCTGTGTCTVTITAAITVTATFTLNTYTLGVTLAGTGVGTVTSAPAGISCGADCSEVVGHGTVMTLTATPVTGSTFTGWSGGGCSGTGTCAVTVTAATTVTATFTLNTYTLAVTKAGTGAGSVTSAPAGITCGATCSATFGHGTSVTLTAAPSAGSTFTSWSGACTGTATTCTVSMTAAASVTATFTLNTYTLTVATAGTGSGTVSSSPAGITCGADCTEVVGHGTVMTLTASPAVGSTFTGWSGGGCTGTGTCAVTVTAATTVTATFTLNSYTLSVAKAGTGAGTVTSMPTGISCGATCSSVYNHGTSVTLTAAPSVGSQFTGWSGGGCSGTGTCVVAMTSATTVTANFTLDTYTLSVTVAASTGTGTVTSSPTGINCGADCTEVYGYGTSVTLTATPAVGSVFSGWSGACTGTGTCTVSITAATAVTATFAIAQYTLTAAKNGTGSGSVSSSPAGITCGATCSATYNYNTSVTLTATPTTGSTFAGWSGGGCSGTGTCVVAVTANTTVTATFNLIPYTLSVTTSGSGSVTSSPAGISCGATCSASFNYGTAVTLTASPSAGYSFSGWSGGGCSGTGTCTVTLTGNTTVTATFSQIFNPLSVTKNGTDTGTVTSSPAGINCGAVCSANIAYGTTITLTATPDANMTFAGWSGGGCTGTGTCTITNMTAAQSVTATFNITQYTLSVTKNGTGGGTVSSTPTGISCGATCSASYNYNTSVTLSASPNAGSVFSGWSGAGCTGTGACTVTMTAARSVTATFTAQYTVTIVMTGSGTVTSTPAGINCTGGTCSAQFNPGTSITLTATSGAGHSWSGWGGSGPSVGCNGPPSCTFTIGGDQNITATFTPINYTVSVTKLGSGTVRSSPGSIVCGSTCSNTFAYGTVVTLTATPGAAYFFSDWLTGDCAGQGSTCTFTVTGNSANQAFFECSTCRLVPVLGRLLTGHNQTSR